MILQVEWRFNSIINSMEFDASGVAMSAPPGPSGRDLPPGLRLQRTPAASASPKSIRWIYTSNASVTHPTNGCCLCGVDTSIAVFRSTRAVGRGGCSLCWSGAG